MEKKGAKIMEDLNKNQNLVNITNLKKVINSLGLTIAGIEGNKDSDTSIEIIIVNEEGAVNKLKKLPNTCGNLAYGGFALNVSEKEYTLVYYPKSDQSKLRDATSSYLSNLGFVVLEILETYPNKGFLFSVKTKNPVLLEKLENFKTLIFEGYVAKEDADDEYHIVYVFPKED